VKSFKVTWTMHVSALTPREARDDAWRQMAGRGHDWCECTNMDRPALTVVADDGHTTESLDESQEGPETK
jgi:hypothetical protein